MVDTEENSDLLQILEAHGRKFLGSFSVPMAGKRKEPSAIEPRSPKKRKVQEEEDEEWSGFSSHEENGRSESEEIGESGHDALQPHQGRLFQPAVVVFSDQQSGGDALAPKVGKAQMKAFMSSKVSKLTQEVEDRSSDEDEGEEDELTNVQNDALLHRLVHTRILSGSLDPELGLTSAQRKKALAGRVLEATGKVKLGKGEGAVRAAERNKAAKRVREGMAIKQKERNEKQLEEAKQLGNYHPSLKKLFDASSQPTSQKRKREKGLKMGVGSFRGGVLKLSKAEISSVQGDGGRSQWNSKKRGGKR